ncbi:hypothetical protein RAS1_00260 [Phycisphaerae bacterium RAS1]|nr:hypothetical protein RAS1_00260 [Phycisphaerae bacterium RAS1]
MAPYKKPSKKQAGPAAPSGVGKKLGLGFVALVAGGVSIYLFTRSSVGELPASYTAHGTCLSCHDFDGEVSYKSGEESPFKCPKCQADAVYPWFMCDSCHRRYVAALEPDANGTLRVKPYSPCPACGELCGHLLFPPLETVKPVGDAPLPKWP